ncbi:1-acyl-sn-glycerol-3-phosphate acyltransferase [Telmatospirillum siberiense]|uniref:1-acyl-sn-glycerol-3-phosphate acyltransferase n=2 Tax=Telmatospirillum siberiense TaxID=382514 RepID=A0A2N3PSK6_9PROT|nr:1-acyl-sn-glycerol-3-phosphate acyltransferase [Telmatospirillum siberiense]
MHRPVTAVLRLCAFVLWMLALVPAVALLGASGLVGPCRSVALFFWRGAVHILGIRLIVRGTPCPDRPLLFVANHASYLDIAVIGALVPAAFVAKQEVGQWPGIGFLAKLGRTVFIERRARRSKVQKDLMIGRLLELGESLVLFPEGTSNDGNRVLPFKSALLSVAEARLPDGRPLPVQPLSLAYTHLGGLPMGRGWRPYYAWYGDMELAPHLWTMLGLGRVTVEVDFYPAVTLDQFGSRKALADHCHDVIRRGVVDALAGRGGQAPLTGSVTVG